MEKIFTLQEFAVWMFLNSGFKWYQPKPYVLTKRKIRKKAVKEVRKTEVGVPYEVVLSKAESVVVPDTNRITDLIVHYLQYYKQWSARRVSSEGRFRQGIGFIKGLNTGMEDIQCTMPGGRLLAIELKVSKSDKQRPEQAKRMQEVQRMGGTYILLRWTTFEEFQHIIQSL
jgi:hypothetical protein